MTFTYNHSRNLSKAANILFIPFFVYKINNHVRTVYHYYVHFKLNFSRSQNHTALRPYNPVNESLYDINCGEHHRALPHRINLFCELNLRM